MKKMMRWKKMDKEKNKLRVFQQITDIRKFYEMQQLRFQNNELDEQTFRIIKADCDKKLERLLKIQEKLNQQ